MNRFDVAIIGGGLSGLISANYLAREGKSVVVLEKSKELGGRGMTLNKNGALFNMGPHAFYLGGEGDAVFRDLGIHVDGAKPSIKGQNILFNDKVIPLSNLFTSRMLSISGKLELIRTLMKFSKLNIDEIPLVSLREWAEKEIKDPMVRTIIYAFCRTATFSLDFDYQLAGPVLDAVKRAFKNGVIYVDRGWQQMVDKLQIQAEKYGVKFMKHTIAKEIELINGHVHRIIVNEGEILEVKNVISTLSPKDTFNLIRDAKKTHLRIWKDQARPSTAACLNLSLKNLPTKRNVALGIDIPIFYSNQSAVANLSDNGTKVMHLIKYNGTSSSDSKLDYELLIETMNKIHPGWQKEVVNEQYLPNMTVAYDFSHIHREDPFPGPSVPEIPGLFVAGEWTCQNNEMLFDAAAGSAKRAAKAVIQFSNMKTFYEKLS